VFTLKVDYDNYFISQNNDNFSPEEQKQNVLYNVHKDRYFLRGLYHYSYKTDYTLFFDILPLTREIVLQSARDLYILPDVPFVKERVGMFNVDLKCKNSHKIFSESILQWDELPWLRHHAAARVRCHSIRI
jgi:hypothetical protein